MEEWLAEVEGIELQVISMQTHVTSSNDNPCWGCLNCCLSRKTTKKLEEVEKLLKAYYSSFAALMSVNYQVTKVEHIPGPSIEGQPTASKNLAKNMDLLSDDGVRRIAVWGKGGVGKTTLILNLNNKLKSDSSNQWFSIVIWATVSKKWDLRKVQTQIAERLNMEVKLDECVESMARRLYRRLVRQRKFLLILDDVWEAIDLDTLGVPQPEIHEGSKIILTTRCLQVYREMKADVHVTVDVLTHAESWHLFSQNAGEVVDSHPIKPIAEAVARECSGLPLAIVTVGTAMRGKRRVELWKDALNELQRSEPNISGIERKLFKPLKWSYDSLQGKNIKPCFLYCSLYPEDFSIEVSELVQCWGAEGFIDEQEKYEDSVNRGIAIVENLKDSCLLEHGIREGTVRMHDVVRDVAIWIASSFKDGSKSLVRSGIGLSHISEVELLKSSKRISFMNNKITSLPDFLIPCPKTSTLLLQCNPTLERVPEQFLVGFRSLSVLNLSETCIQSLPLSLTQLSELRALLLRGCNRLQELPPLGGLRKLQQIDLCATRVGELPETVQELRNLRLLNLSQSCYLKTICDGLAFKLSGLEVLAITECTYQWDVKGKKMVMLVLGCLEPLVSIHIWLDSIPHLHGKHPNRIASLKRFQIFIGPGAHENDLPTKYDERKVILSNFDVSEEKIRGVLSNATSLVLNSCAKVEWMSIPDLYHFQGLKSLVIVNCHGLGSSAGSFGEELPNLEELYIHGNNEYLPCMWLLSKFGNLPRLRSIEVSRCSQLISFFPPLSWPLENLEELKISSCNNLKELLSHPASDLMFPNLRRMELKNLPSLANISSDAGSWPNLKQLEVINCNLLK